MQASDYSIRDVSPSGPVSIQLLQTHTRTECVLSWSVPNPPLFFSPRLFSSALSRSNLMTAAASVRLCSDQGANAEAEK